MSNVSNHKKRTEVNSSSPFCLYPEYHQQKDKCCKYKTIATIAAIAAMVNNGHTRPITAAID